MGLSGVADFRVCASRVCSQTFPCDSPICDNKSAARTRAWNKQIFPSAGGCGMENCAAYLHICLQALCHSLSTRSNRNDKSK